MEAQGQRRPLGHHHMGDGMVWMWWSLSPGHRTCSLAMAPQGKLRKFSEAAGNVCSTCSKWPMLHLALPSEQLNLSESPLLHQLHFVFALELGSFPGLNHISLLEAFEPVSENVTFWLQFPE